MDMRLPLQFIWFDRPYNFVYKNKDTEFNLKDASAPFRREGVGVTTVGTFCAPSPNSKATTLHIKKKTKNPGGNYLLSAFAVEFSIEAVPHVRDNLLFISHMYNLLLFKESI